MDDYAAVSPYVDEDFDPDSPKKPRPPFTFPSDTPQVSDPYPPVQQPTPEAPKIQSDFPAAASPSVGMIKPSHAPIEVDDNPPPPADTWQKPSMGKRIGQTIGGILLNRIAPEEAQKLRYEGIDPTGYHQAEQQRITEQSLGNQQKQATIADTKAQTTERGAQATQYDMVPVQIPGQTEPVMVQRKNSESLIQHLLGGQNAAFQHLVIEDPEGNPKAALFDKSKGQYIDPDTKQVIPNAKPFQKSAPAEKGEDAFISQYLADNKLDRTAKNIEKARKEYAASGQAPDRPERGSFVPLYDQKSGALAGFFNPATGEHRAAPTGATTGQGVTREDKQTAATKKENEKYQSILDEVDTAKDLKKQGDAGNAEADVGLTLSFFKTMRGAQGGNIRFTQQENNLIMGARSFMDSLQVSGNKVFSHGEPLSKDQRQQMLDAMDTFAAAAKRHMSGATQTEGSKEPPKVGDVVKGHKFLGGDPSKPESWEKVKTP